eukprot:TRINITY_DN48625_c0_g1_i1.p1 TRINITY_DN48625_c0_g1~~TRINITY_DN48625_c0_g1_i1.p1  ORF type:complete len:419 (-),score=65.09 TRINITY_DN48625_c0_g1_i1:65-1321(-)
MPSTLRTAVVARGFSGVPSTDVSDHDRGTAEEDPLLSPSSTRRTQWQFGCLIALCLTIIAVLAFQLRGRDGGRGGSGVAEPWRQCDAPGRPGGPVEDLHLHLLFMAIDEVPHPEIWRQFFHAAPTGSFHAWMHCKQYESCKASLEQNGLAEFFQVVPTVYNIWCQDLLSPMLQLLRFALQAITVRPRMTEKFLFISDTTLPVKPFSIIRAELSKRPFASDFCVFPTFTWPVAPDKSVYKVKGQTWSVLARQDAEKLVNSLPAPMADQAVQIPTLQNFSYTEFKNAYCIDETVVFTMIFGPFWPERKNVYPGIGPLYLHEAREKPLEQGCCRTWIMLHPNQAMVNHEKQVSQLGQLLAAVEGSDGTAIEAPLTHKVEAIYLISALGPQGMKAFRASSFLFARKFTANASLEGFAEIMFS